MADRMGLYPERRGKIHYCTETSGTETKSTRCGECGFNVETTADPDEITCGNCRKLLEKDVEKVKTPGKYKISGKVPGPCLVMITTESTLERWDMLTYSLIDTADIKAESLDRLTGRAREFTTVTITGGEPLLYPGKIEKLAYNLKKVNPYVEINLVTSASLHINRPSSVMSIISEYCTENIDNLTIAAYEETVEGVVKVIENLPRNLMVTVEAESSCIDSLDVDFHKTLLRSADAVIPISCYYRENLKMKYIV